MSDFIYSRHLSSVASMEQQLRNIMPCPESVEVKSFCGEWGKLSVSLGPYNGFMPYEIDSHICVVIGGPVLCWRDNDFLTENKYSATAVQGILERWLRGNMNWSEDLSGPFVVCIIDKINKELHAITDLMMFIPTYEYNEDNTLVLSTHVDVAANISRQKQEVDEVSIVDFILHGFITYPHTIYKNIYQLSPAAKHQWQLENTVCKVQRNDYWQPVENNSYKSIDEAANILRNSLNDYVDRVTNNMSEIGQFISAGEDSRSIAGLLPQRLKRVAYVYVDSKNREFQLAQRVSEVYGCDFNYILRKGSHYLDILPTASKLVGGGQQYTHAHTLGLVEISGADQHTAVFGGYASDSLLKAMHTQRYKYCQKLPFLPEIEMPGETRTRPLLSSIFSKESLLNIDKRRKKHMEHIKLLRPTSYHEWFMLWPYSMREAMPNIAVNRRLFPSYEIYTSKDVVKISATVPTHWKLNRKLFQKTVKYALSDSKHIPHADGRFPYYPWYINCFLQLPVWSKNIVNKFLNVKKSDGPWGDWRQLSEVMELMIEQEDKVKLFHMLNTSYIDCDSLSVVQKNNYLTMLHFINREID